FIRSPLQPKSMSRNRMGSTRSITKPARTARFLNSQPTRETPIITPNVSLRPDSTSRTSTRSNAPSSDASIFSAVLLQRQNKWIKTFAAELFFELFDILKIGEAADANPIQGRIGRNTLDESLRVAFF